MRLARFLEAEDDRPQIGLAKPMGNRATEDAGFPRRIGCAIALAGDDQDEPDLIRRGDPQEPAKRRVRLGLVQPMQIDGALNVDVTACHLFAIPRLERNEAGHGGTRV